MAKATPTTGSRMVSMAVLKTLKKWNCDMLLQGRIYFLLQVSRADMNIARRPAYNGLTNNISTVLQELKGYPWPAGTEDFVNVRVKGEYIQSYSKHFNI